MIAVFVQGELIIGYKECTEEESVTFELDYEIFDVLPPELNTFGDNKAYSIDRVTKAITSRLLPPEQESDTQKIARLETTNADLESRLGDVEMYLAEIIMA
jgi:hypothetical protein